MSGRPHQSVDDLFVRALELSDSERAQFLRELDDSVRIRVEDLLKADRLAGSAGEKFLPCASPVDPGASDADRPRSVPRLSWEEFQRRLADSGVMTDEEIRRFIAETVDAEPSDDCRDLARVLIQQHRLTAWQVQQILAGRGKNLVLGNYVILDKLGQGGMGMVFRAEHRRMKRIVALKALSPSLTKTPEFVSRFQREVHAAARLEHPNIVPAHDADQVGNVHFLVMQFVDGEDLSSIVKRQGPFPLARAIDLTQQAARGLQYAHEQGVIHRDIKPANLLLDRTGTVKILDMGLARLDAASDAVHSLTGTGMVMGTVDYMAPEQAEDSKRADARADLYSLGCTLYYLLSGNPVYEGTTVIERLLAHREQPIPSLSTDVQDIPPILDAIFRTMVAKDPDDRYPSLAAAIAALGSVRESLPAAVPGSELQSGSGAWTESRIGNHTEAARARPIDAECVFLFRGDAAAGGNRISEIPSLKGPSCSQ